MQLSTLTVVILAAASAVIDAGVLPLEELFLPAGIIDSSLVRNAFIRA